MLNSVKQEIKDNAMKEMAALSKKGKEAFVGFGNILAQFGTLQQNMNALILDGTFTADELSDLLEDFAAYPADIRALHEQAGSLIPTAE